MKQFRGTLRLAVAVNVVVGVVLTGFAASYLSERRWGYAAYFFVLAAMNTSWAWKGWRNGHRERREDDQRRAGGGPGSLASAHPLYAGAGLPSYAGEGPRVNDFEIPDSASPVLGWRTWKIEWDQDIPLLGASTRSCIWPAGEKLVADCVLPNDVARMAHLLGSIYGDSDLLSPSHSISPDASCQCGIYALKDAKSALQYKGIVFGEVKLWGKVIEGTKGYRAQYAYPSRLWIDLPKRPDLPKLEDIKDVLRSTGLPEPDEPLAPLYETYCQRVREDWEDQVGKRLEIAARLSESYGVPCVPVFPDQRVSLLESVCA